LDKFGDVQVFRSHREPFKLTASPVKQTANHSVFLIACRI
jgi:hypothetical protein